MSRCLVIYIYIYSPGNYEQQKTIDYEDEIIDNNSCQCFARIIVNFSLFYLVTF